MDPIAFMKTIYLGDRACKKIIIDGWNNQVMIQVNNISRIRDPSGHWNFYTDEDIEDGFIVLSQIRSFIMEPRGLIPNDYIEARVDPLQNKNVLGKTLYLFTFYIGHVDELGNSQEITVKIEATNIHLEDPSRPSIQIIN